jgi:hypothetical protein
MVIGVKINLGSKPEKTYHWGTVFILYVSLTLSWGEVGVIDRHSYDSFKIFRKQKPTVSLH